MPIYHLRYAPKSNDPHRPFYESLPEGRTHESFWELATRFEARYPVISPCSAFMHILRQKFLSIQHLEYFEFNMSAFRPYQNQASRTCGMYVWPQISISQKGINLLKIRDPELASLLVEGEYIPEDIEENFETLTYRENVECAENV